MYCQSLDIPDVKILRPVQHEDARGFFSEIYNAREMAAAGLNLNFVQENLAFSKQAGTVRGIHFQTPPHEQIKLVQVVRGAIYDVAVDLRAGSPWYGKFVAAEISADNWNQILIPEGFGHGLVTLEDDTTVLYRVTAHFSREHDKGVRWDDRELGIAWPLRGRKPLLSAKDIELPTLADFDTPFVYGEETQ
jgi:dTDP-4-dehydrorhamnose 3,5-epimerase